MRGESKAFESRSTLVPIVRGLTAMMGLGIPGLFTFSLLCTTLFFVSNSHKDFEPEYDPLEVSFVSSLASLSPSDPGGLGVGTLCRF